MHHYSALTLFTQATNGLVPAAAYAAHHILPTG